jgi:activator of HSP90 ATPase
VKVRRDSGVLPKDYVEHILHSSFYVEDSCDFSGNTSRRGSQRKIMNDQSKLGTARLSGRRRMLVATASGVTGLAMAPLRSLAPVQDGVSRTAELIHHETIFKAIPKRVYEALTDAKRFEGVTKLSFAVQSGMALGNEPTQINREPGGPFTLFRGHIIGRLIELVANQRIVQAWRVVTWTSGIYSIARFELTEQGSDTKLVLEHAGFPDGDGQRLAEGWKVNYWEPLEKYLSVARR